MDDQEIQIASFGAESADPSTADIEGKLEIKITKAIRFHGTDPCILTTFRSNVFIRMSKIQEACPLILLTELMWNPKGDAEVVFDVVGGNSHVDISIYDLGGKIEEFLGKVEFELQLSKYIPIKGWYRVHGVESVITGSIYVEINFQRTEKKRYRPEDFTILKLLGKGSYGYVYQVCEKETRRIYAMKVLQKNTAENRKVAHIVDERNILVQTSIENAPFIVKLRISFQTSTKLYLVTDYVAGGDLFWHLEKEGRFGENKAKFYIAELILALQHRLPRSQTRKRPT